MSETDEQLSPIQKFERSELERSYRAVLGTAEGRRVLFDILEKCAIYTEAFVADSDITVFTLGQQSSGRKIIAELDAIDPRLYPELLLARADMRVMDQAVASRAAQTEDIEDAP